MVIDIAIGVLILIALILGYQRGVIQPLMAEIFFFGTLLIVFRFHDQYTSLLEKTVHLNSYMRSLYNKLGVSSRSAATRYALEHHLT